MSRPKPTDLDDRTAARPLAAPAENPGPCRRSFLQLASGAALGALLGQALPGCELAEVRGDPPPPKLEFDLGTRALAPLASVAGVAAVDAGQMKLLLIRSSEAEVIALDRLCTHLSCDLDPGQAGQWDAANREMTCACHLAKFDVSGKVLRGPATRDLRSYPVTFDPSTGRGSVDLT